MIVQKTTLRFDPSPSPDTVGYRLYMAESPTPVDYDSPSFELGNQTEINMATLEGIQTKDGVYNLGIAAIDDAGNLSSMVKLEDIPIDFAAPDPPSNLQILRG